MNKTVFLPAIGCLLGAGIFIWILFYSNKANSNSGYDKVNDYINNCENIQLKINNYVQKSGFIDGDKKLLGSVSYPASQTYFYDNFYKKYFVIELFSGNLHKGGNIDYSAVLTLFIHDIEQSESITASVNKIELADPGYGT